MALASDRLPRAPIFPSSGLTKANTGYEQPGRRGGPHGGRRLDGDVQASDVRRWRLPPPAPVAAAYGEPTQAGSTRKARAGSRPTRSTVTPTPARLLTPGRPRGHDHYDHCPPRPDRRNGHDRHTRRRHRLALRLTATSHGRVPLRVLRADRTRARGAPHPPVRPTPARQPNSR